MFGYKTYSKDNGESALVESLRVFEINLEVFFEVLGIRQDKNTNPSLTSFFCN